MTLSHLKQMKQSAQKIACLTAYDAAFSAIEAQAGVDVILVGDSLGMVVQGQSSTLPVTLDEMVYHTQMVQRGNPSAWCIADMPFMADATVESTLQAASRLMKEGQANMVKLEGGLRVLDAVTILSSLGIPVCGHLGLLPQSVNKTGYKVQGREVSQAERILNEALALEEAGAEMIVLECVPASLAKRITQACQIPIIGIGSGKDTDGQVLVLHDILGLTLGHPPKFSKNFMINASSIQNAIEAYVDDVKSSDFPEACHILVAK